MYYVVIYNQKDNTFHRETVVDPVDLGFTENEAKHIRNQVKQFDMLGFTHGGKSYEIYNLEKYRIMIAGKE